MAEDVRQAIREFTCINCWHMNPGESAAMWSLYSPNYGIAIRSTIGRLIKSFRSSPIPIKIGAVRYLNFEALRRSEAAALHSWRFVKRKSFEHEKELRAAILEPDVSKLDLSGLAVDVDVPVLIERVFVSPTLDSWVAQMVEEELKLYDLHDLVVHSSLYSKNLD